MRRQVELLDKRLRGGVLECVVVQDPRRAAARHRGAPTVILAKTVKGYGLGESGEGKNITHQQKKLNEDELRAFRDRFEIPISDDEINEAPFCRFKEGTKVNARRLQLSKNVLKQLVFPDNALTVVKFSRKAVYKTDECVGCDKCVFICPYDAIVWKDVSTPEIKTEDCMGCGACALVCPHQAIELRGYEFEPVSEIIKNCSGKVANIRAQGKSPVLLFVCQWSEFSALDDVQKGCLTDNITIIELPCAKGFDPVLVLEALSMGYDGVMAVICPEELCKLEEGTYLGERNFSALKVVLKQYGLQDRFESFRVSPKYPGEFKEKLEAFKKNVSSIPMSEEKSSSPL